MICMEKQHKWNMLMDNDTENCKIKMTEGQMTVEYIVNRIK
jgi:hypothetical protein